MLNELLLLEQEFDSLKFQTEYTMKIVLYGFKSSLYCYYICRSN